VSVEFSTFSKARLARALLAWLWARSFGEASSPHSVAIAPAEAMETLFAAWFTEIVHNAPATSASTEDLPDFFNSPTSWPMPPRSWTAV
jgi:hypothetical protein